MEYIKVLGEYLNKKQNRKIDFKGIKTHPVYRDNLFSYGIDDYLISKNREEIWNLLITLSSRKAEDYPAKLAKKYTHKKYTKAKDKKVEEFKVRNKKYYIVLL